MNFTTIKEAKLSTGLSYLGSVNKSAKLKKNGKVSMQHTYGLYLAPASISGHNTCTNSTPECRLGCLHSSGHAGMEMLSGRNRIEKSRIKKTKLLFEQESFFMDWLITEIKGKKITAEKQGFGFSVRLNCTSDIDWANLKVNGKNIFEIFSDVQFYDYTKNPTKFINIDSNYHLTFSYTGINWNRCLDLLSKGYNIAMVFNVKKEKDIPAMYNGFEVVNGDETDYRVNDGNGVIIGLKWKRIANKENELKVLNSHFVVNVPNVQNAQTNYNEWQKHLKTLKLAS